LKINTLVCGGVGGNAGGFACISSPSPSEAARHSEKSEESKNIKKPTYEQNSDRERERTNLKTGNYAKSST